MLTLTYREPQQYIRFRVQYPHSSLDASIWFSEQELSDAFITAMIDRLTKYKIDRKFDEW